VLGGGRPRPCAGRQWSARGIQTGSVGARGRSPVSGGAGANLPRHPGVPGPRGLRRVRGAGELLGRAGAWCARLCPGPFGAGMSGAAGGRAVARPGGVGWRARPPASSVRNCRGGRGCPPVSGRGGGGDREPPGSEILARGPGQCPGVTGCAPARSAWVGSGVAGGTVTDTPPAGRAPGQLSAELAGAGGGGVPGGIPRFWEGAGWGTDGPRANRPFY